MRKAIVYTRVSTQEQANSRLGLESQEQLCREFCAREGLEIVQIVSDPGVSASIPLFERLGGRTLIDAAAKGDVTVVALCQDRLFRSICDCIATLERWDELGVTLATVDGGEIGIEEPEDFLKTGINALFSEYERRKARQRTKRGMAAAKARGVVLGHAPLGYQNVAGVVSVNPEEMQVVNLIRSMGSLPYAEIARRLNAQGVKTRHGKAWKHVQVARTLRRAQ